ncbi:hypothetical protein HPB48_025537 [Haemaphysalis longicornis]|uniref:EF-hand domain-containing protein n=1 Tax=Haemaphysalis longicornis TaxID=44386 RepID=A0A9J6GZA2_HAELO|nr:hypothetical protein HPB48_025537 [Haemaphysalis longicornis]
MFAPQLYDNDKDGEIPLKEIKQLFRGKNVDLERDIPASILDEILEQADADNNGKLSFAEFKKMVRLFCEGGSGEGGGTPSIERSLRCEFMFRLRPGSSLDRKGPDEKVWAR